MTNQKWTRIPEQIPVDLHPGPKPYPRQLNEDGIVTWYTSNECPTCSTIFKPKEGEYKFCSICGCCTQIWIRKFMKLEGAVNHDYATLCQECLLKSGNIGMHVIPPPSIKDPSQYPR